MTSRLSTLRYTALAPVLSLTLALGAASAQTKVARDNNKFTPAQDVELGRQAAAEVRKEMPMLDDDGVEEYVEGVGERLVNGIPPELREKDFDYTFDIVNLKEINAFALPGGPMFLHRGMIEASRTEGEMAGVLAHEIAHVALRHGTAQATKAEKFQIGAIAGQVLGAIVGGAAGSVIAQGSQFGLGAYFLKYSREYEREADLLGAQIMARAGYDPRQMAAMFQTIQREGGGRGGPEWLSSHPDPGNRSQAIAREAASLRVERQASPTDAQFSRVKARLKSMSPARSSEDVAKENASRRRSDAPVGTAGRSVSVEPPAREFQTYTRGDFLRLSVPANWRERGSERTLTYAPEGGFYQGEGGATAFTHGIEVGVAPGAGGDLQRATEELLAGFRRANPQLRQQSGFRRENIGGRQGLTSTLTNVSEVTGRREVVTISTAPLRDGSLLYLIGVAPENEAGLYQDVFRRVRGSLQLADR